MTLEEIGEAMRAQLDSKNSARERGLTLSRKAIRLSANSIRAVHRNEKDVAEKGMAEVKLLLDEARDAMAGHPAVLHAGFFHDAAKEYAEARLTYAFVFGQDLPTPEDVGVDPPAYLNGLGEAVGELRRHLLDLMRRGELDRSEELLGDMDDVYYMLSSMDYPDGVTAGLRRTTDMVRGVLERTRGDLTTTIIQNKLKVALDSATSSGK